MAIIRIIDESGIDSVEVFSAKVGIKIDGNVLEPAYVEEIEVENNGEVVQITDDCGRQEQRRPNEGLWTIQIQGIITKEGDDGDFLLRDAMKLQEGELIELISDFEIEGPIVVSNVICGQSTDIVDIDIGNGPQLAFSFQITLGEEDSDR